MFWFRREEQPAFVWKFTNIRSALFLRTDLLAVADDRQTTFRRFPDNQVLQTLPVGGYLAVHPDRTLLAIGSWGTVWLYDPVSGERQATFNCWPRGDHVYPMSLAFSLMGSILAVSESHYSRGLEVQLWDVMSQQQIDSILLADPDATVIVALAFSPDDEHLVVGTNAGVWLVDVAQRTVSRQIQPRPSGSITFSPDGSRLVLGGKFIRVYDTATWQLAYEITFPEVLKDRITPEKFYIFSMNVTISPDGRWLATPN
ncbi:WD40 repeat domain-containing protein, partial [Chloroflexus sp.]|uniref:WD40 repeat domain-containing protein n=1 Tax=Chloroflexus sp. TaxID=1904827 RepID=UPI00404B0074